MSGLWIMLLGGVMFMFVGGEVKHIAFAVGGAILFSGTYSINLLLLLKVAFIQKVGFVDKIS